jgi:tetratricopeptide (TPR) repeat protein
VAAVVKHNLGLVLAEAAQLEEAERLERQALEAFAAHRVTRSEALSRAYLALIAHDRGDLETAEREARGALPAMARYPSTNAHGHAILARVLLSKGRVDEAVFAATRAMSLLHSVGFMHEGEGRARLVHAEALHAAGRPDEAAVAIRDARDFVDQRVGTIPDEALRAVARGAREHARIIALSTEWLA